MKNISSMDEFGDRMKEYESLSESRLMPLLPTFARVDGRSFHSFTKGMARPYDGKFSEAMIRTAKLLAVETNARMAYTQSDEITLAWYSTDYRSQIWFDGRHSKMVSQIAALATLFFYRECLAVFPEYAERLPSFDARVWQVPNVQEGANVFLWRALDARKNSISMAAQSLFSHKELHGKGSSEKLKMLESKGCVWDHFPSMFSKGTFIQRRLVKKPFTDEEISALPPKHEAHLNPNLIIERNEWVEISMPLFCRVINRPEVVFDGAEPIVNSDEEQS